MRAPENDRPTSGSKEMAESEYPDGVLFPDELSPKQFKILVESMRYDGVMIEIIRKNDKFVHFILNGFEMVDCNSKIYLEAVNSFKGKLNLLSHYEEALEETE